ncbi:MAG: EAL domain-containing protein [Clostridia bacterium]|nr:EAL domain-containing protein [Clostridia bacterium]
MRLFKPMILLLALGTLLLACIPTASASVVCSPDNQGNGRSVFVAGNPDLYPVEYFNEKTGCYEGVLPRLYERISNETGIDFTYIYSSSENRQAYLAKNGQVDMVSAYVAGSAPGSYVPEDRTMLRFTHEGVDYTVAIGFTENCDVTAREKIRAYLEEMTEGDLTALTVSFVMEQKRAARNVLQYWIALAVAVLLILAVLWIRARRKRKKSERLRSQIHEKTGLFTHRYLEDFLDNTLPGELRERYAAAHISIDYGNLLKYYGKDNADRLEIWIASRLLEFCDEREIAAYVDDVSFVVLYQEPTEEAIRERLEALVALLNKDNGILTEDYKITVRAGGYRLRRQKDASARVCSIADEAYRRAEELEVNCFFADTAFIKLVERREQLQRETVQAVKKGQILYYMQYVVDLKKNCVYGAEALSRWEHPREGLLSPGVYIGLMQHAKVIGVLDYYMFEHSCQQLERWESEGLTDFCVSCNFDRLTVGTSDFYERILEIASKYRFNRNHMILEITEDTFVYNRGNACKNTKLLSDAGFSLALDDFGSGYASFRNLIEYHVTHLKLDRSMLSLLDTPDGVTLLNGIITAAHSLGVTVLMEGVETPEQLERVRAMDVDLVQGFIFSRVIPQIELGRVRKRLEKRLASGVLPDGAFTFADVNPDAPEDNVYEDDDDESGANGVRYRWSFTARLHRAPQEIADYYTQLKNQLLRYKKVRSRVSWSCDTISHRRAPIVKFVMRQKSLLVYLALNPAEFEETKYFFTDASEKKKYEQVPLRLKIRGARGFKHAAELIEILAQRLELQELASFEPQDYALPLKSVEELIQEGLIKVNDRALAVLTEDALAIPAPPATDSDAKLFALSESEQHYLSNEENIMENTVIIKKDEIMQENEAQVFTQYRWSFMARLHQAPREIAAYYTEIKNAFLSYKKVKSRISWSCDTINAGRDQLAKMVITTKTLYVYLALDPASFVDSKYFFRDFSDTKKYEKVPMRIKVRSERGVRHVIELIEKMAELYNLTLAKNYEAQEFALPYKSFEELLSLELIKKVEARADESDDPDALAAAVILEEPVVEEPAIEEPVVEEPAVEEPVVEEPVAEEPAVEEPVVEEEPQMPVPTAVVEETPAEKLQNAELVDAETIHVAFLERLCRQFDADELNAHVKIVYKKKREKKTSIFDIIMRRNRS